MIAIQIAIQIAPCPICRQDNYYTMNQLAEMAGHIHCAVCTTWFIPHPLSTILATGLDARDATTDR